MLKCAVQLVTTRRGNLHAGGNSAGKPVALLAQGVAQYMSRSTPKAAADTGACACDGDIIDMFVPFVLHPHTIELIKAGLEATAAGQILNYVADSTVVFLSAAVAAQPSAESSDKKKKTDKDSRGIRGAVGAVATFIASDITVVTSPRALEWVSVNVSSPIIILYALLIYCIFPATGTEAGSTVSGGCRRRACLLLIVCICGLLGPVRWQLHCACRHSRAPSRSVVNGFGQCDRVWGCFKGTRSACRFVGHSL